MRKASDTDLEANAALFESLAMIRDAHLPNPCPSCKSIEDHFQCMRCKECILDDGALDRVREYDACPECRCTKFQGVIIKIPWAMTFAESLREQVEKGKKPTAKQLAKVHELRLQLDQGLPFIWEKPAIMWLTPKMPVCWDRGVRLLEDAGKLSADEVSKLVTIGNDEFVFLTQAAAQEDIDRVRTLLRACIYEWTGFTALVTRPYWRAVMTRLTVPVSNSVSLERATHDFSYFMIELDKVHLWLVGRKPPLVRDDCPSHLFELRDQACRGDDEAALVLRDAIMEGSTQTAMKRGRV